MAARLCAFCAGQLTAGIEECPVCGHTQPERTAITTQPDDPADQEEVRLRPPPGLGQAAGEVDNRLRDGLFRNAFLGGMGLAVVGGIWLLLSGKADGFLLLVGSPLLGLIAATFSLAGTQLLSGLYELLAGPDPRRDVAPDVTRMSPEKGQPAKEEGIQPSLPPSPVTARPKEQPAAAAPSDDAPPQGAGVELPSPFVPVLLTGLVVGFGVQYAFWGGLVEALGSAVFLGLPCGFVLGALAVRWARGLARRG